MSSPLSVVVGVIENANHEILLAQRLAKGIYDNFWEFPGGKVEKNEIPRQALTRELQEELGIEVQCAKPLIRVRHNYGERQVLLDVWHVTEYQGEPYGREGQPVMWVPRHQLREHRLLPANHPIVTAIILPQHYVITPTGISEEKLYLYVKSLLQKDYKFIRFHARGWNAAHYLSALHNLIKIGKPYQAQFMVDGEPDILKDFPVAGLHLTSQQLMSYRQRPVSENYLLGVSCHNETELTQAKKIQADFAMLAPVLPTITHPNAKLLGWQKFTTLVNKANFPVYALGGMSFNQPAIWFGAQGIAGIRLFQNII